MKDQQEIEELLRDCKVDLFAIESLVNVVGNLAAQISNGTFPNLKGEDPKEEGMKLLSAFADIDTIFTRYLSPTIQTAEIMAQSKRKLKLMPQCPRCSSLMRYERIIVSDGESCESWACPKCGEVVDEVVIFNRQTRGRRGLGKDSTVVLALPLPEGEIESKSSDGIFNSPYFLF